MDEGWAGVVTWFFARGSTTEPLAGAQINLRGTELRCGDTKGVFLKREEDAKGRIDYCFWARRFFSAETTASFTSSSALATSTI